MTRSPTTAVGGLLAAVFWAAATTTAPAAEGSAGATTAAAQPLVYQPPLRGAPKGRVGGGTRGLGPGLVIATVAPDHTGQTSKAQPTLYWFISQPAQARIELTLTTADDIQPFFETRLDPIVTPGIQSFELAKHDLALEPGTEYDWYVAVVPDSEQRSHDVLASGRIVWVEPPAQLRAQLAAEPEAEYRVYAANGYWYDAFDSVTRLAAAHAGQPSLQTHCAELLQQVGLGHIAAQCRAPRGH